MMVDVKWICVVIIVCCVVISFLITPFTPELFPVYALGVIGIVMMVIGVRQLEG